MDKKQIKSGIKRWYKWLAVGYDSSGITLTNNSKEIINDIVNEFVERANFEVDIDDHDLGLEIAAYLYGTGSAFENVSGEQRITNILNDFPSLSCFETNDPRYAKIIKR